MGLLGRRKELPDPIPFDQLQAGEQEVVAHYDLLVGRIIDTATGVFELYLKLELNGRELGPEERAAVSRKLAEVARLGRALDDDRDLVLLMAEGGFDMRPSIAFLRTLQHSLVLALSEAPERRVRAIGSDDLKARARTVYLQWKELQGKDA